MKPHRPLLDHPNILARVVGLLAGLAWIVSGAARADELPRYRLKVGQELVYRSTDPPKERDDGKGNKNSNHYTFEWTVYVAGQNADGGWRLVFLAKRISTSVRNGKESSQEFMWDGYFDLASDGRLVENRTLGPMADPTMIFPPLPPDLASMNASWSSTVGFDDTRRKLRASADQSAARAGDWLFTEQPETAFDAIYLLSTHHDYAFDRKQGLVRKVTRISRQGWPQRRNEEPSILTIELVSRRMLEEADLGALSDETSGYFAGRESYDKLLARAGQDFAHAAELLDQAEAELKQLQEQLKLPVVRSILETKLKQHANLRDDLMNQAEEFGPLIDKPSENWKTVDLDGNPHSLVDYRGKVVVLDFWYRGCGWCIRAMPQMKQLSNDFQGQAVAILGINSDEKESDARFVMDKLNLNYVTLKNRHEGEQINAKYLVHGWPTLILIDTSGAIRHFHSGYSPTLRHDLGEKIREVLAENQPAPAK